MKKQILFLATIATIFASCQKDETVVPTNTQITPDYTTAVSVKENSIYVSLDTTKKSVTTIPLSSWDIALQTGANGVEVELNSGAGIYGYKSTSTNFAEALVGPTNASNWKFTPPSGDFKKSVFYGYTADSIYLVGKSAYDASHILTFSALYKIKIINNPLTNTYKLVVGTPTATANFDTITVSKTSATNASKVLVSLTTKALAAIQPPASADYDIILTTFTDIHTAMGATQPTLLTGVFCNYGVVVGNLLENTTADASKTAYANVTMANIPTARDAASLQQDFIGSNWKDFDYATNKYGYKDKWVYWLYRMNTHAIYKIQFLNYLNAEGKSGFISYRVSKL